MRKPTKYIKALTEEEQQELRSIHKTDAVSRRRMRAHVILLSFRRYSIDQIADIYEVDRDRVSQWLNWWEESRFDGLDDDPRSGRPPKLSPEEQAQAIEQTLQEPRLLRQGLHWIKTTFQHTVSSHTLKRWLSAAGYRWKRMRRSLRGSRDEEAFRTAQETLADLRQYCSSPNREFDLWYADEAGFTTIPSVPYAWQKVGERLELASAHGPRQNVFGLLSLHQQFHSYAFAQSLDSATIIACLDDFCSRLRRPALIVLDNAPVHRSEDFDDRREEWENEGLYLLSLPPYCPELNLIEHLWRKVKYEWLPLCASESFARLTEELFAVLKEIGSKYRITFA